MPERGAPPNVHPLQRRVLEAFAALSTPLLPGDYLELINPLWSTRELRGRVEEVKPETADAATVLIKPGYRWGGHRPGQYLRIGVEIDGVRHWRAYSLTSDPYRRDGLLSVTVKSVDSGTVSRHLVREAGRGTILSLGGVEGDFTLPDEAPGKLLFVTAGSGITPIMSMLRHLDGSEAMGDIVMLHSARHTDDVIFGSELRRLAEQHASFKLHEQLTRENGRLGPGDLDQLCPDWRERDTYISGPSEMLDAFGELYEREGLSERLHMERFQPSLGIGHAEEGSGGEITFLKSGCTAQSDGSAPILVAGEDVGLRLPYGCREGICHTCVGELHSGRVRDLRNGEVHGERGEMVRTCIHAPEGPIEIEL